jgi:hypothetical protein
MTLSGHTGYIMWIHSSLQTQLFNDPDGHYLTLAEKIISSKLRIRWAGYFNLKV